MLKNGRCFSVFLLVFTLLVSTIIPYSVNAEQIVTEKEQFVEEINENEALPVNKEEEQKNTDPELEKDTQDDLKIVEDKQDAVKSQELEQADEDEEDHIEFFEVKTVNMTVMSISVLENGIRDGKVKTLKSNLKKLGFTVPGNGTTLFGKETEKQVRAFQQYYGLAADGKAGPATLNKIDSIVKSPLQNGKRHNDTKKLKADLKSIGYPVPGNGTTLYGKDTESVVKKFQKAQGLVVNGIADEVTLNKIASLKKIKEDPDVLQNGIRHAKVKSLKENLKKLGFTVPGNGTTLFGKDTEKKVKDFQKYYGLSADGKAGPATLNKIDSIVKSPLQNGKRHNDTKKLKADLKLIGYPVPGNGTTLYGKDTEAVVKKFQKAQGLVVNGIADEVTLNKIASLKKEKEDPNILQNGVRHAKVKTLKANLKKLGFTVPGNGTTLFGKDTEKKVKEFQSYYGLAADGKAGSATLNKIDSILKSPLQNGKRHNDTKKLKADLKSIGYPVPGNGTTLYGKETEKIVKQFQKDYKLTVNGIADEVTLAKIASLVKTTSKNTKIFIDAGHGGTDPGAKYGNLYEKNLTLDIAKRTEKYLKQYKGVTTKMSRTTDKALSLAQRTKMANDWKADFFFSVHINSGGGTGIESFIYNNKPSQDEINKQKIIHDHIAKNVDDRDRGKKCANFHVLRESNMTAMLFEYYFIDTASDRNKLNNASYRDKLAKLTAEGIAKAHGLKK